MNQPFLFFIFILPAAFFLGLNDIFVKRILKEKISEQALLSVTLFFSGALLFLFSFFAGFPKIQPAFWPAFSATVALNVFGQLAWYKALNRGEASFISPLRLLIPPFVILTGFFILGETPSFWGITGVLIAVAGLCFLFDFQANFFKKTFLKTLAVPAVLWGFGGVLAFSWSFPFDKRAVLNSSALFFTSTALIVIGLVSAFIAILAGRRKNQPVFENVWPAKKLIMINIFCLALGAFLANYAFNFALAAYVSSAKRTQVFWTIIFSGALLKEGNILKKLIATGIMFVGVAITAFLG